MVPNEPIAHRISVRYDKLDIYRRASQQRRFLIMLRSCKYCGRIHDSKYNCGKKPRRNRKTQAETEAEAFRRTSAWKRMSLDVRDRDKWLCQVCLRGLYLSPRALSYHNVSVHHIVPLAEDRTQALEPGNLLTLCQLHHELAESGYIPRDELRRIAEEQEEGAAGRMAPVPPGG
jgi:hypothetical protein